MSILGILSQKPWTSDQAAIDNKHSGKSSSMPLPRVALYVLMAVIGVLFTLFSVAYIGRMAYGDWRILPEPVSYTHLRAHETVRNRVFQRIP